MGFFTRDRAEKVVEYHHYPEASFISNRPRLAWWYRFLLGRPMDNIRWTNSTFWHPASRGEPHRWLRLAGWQRSAIRLALLHLALTFPALLLLHRLGADQVVAHIVIAHALIAAPILLLIQWRLILEHGLQLPWLEREQREETEQDAPTALELEQEETPGALTLRMRTLIEGRRSWREEIVEPLAKALAESLDNIYRPGDTDWITVPRSYLTPGGGSVEIMLPSGFSGAMAAKRRIIEETVARKLGMLEPVFTWQTQGKHPRLLVSTPPAPPKVAKWSDYRELVMSVSEAYRPVLGVVARSRSADPDAAHPLLSAEMVSDSPHVALSAGSGAGKSMMSRAIIMQALHWGWGVVILDWKSESHSWAKGLPGVTYVTTEQGIHEMGERIGQEVDIRKEQGVFGRAKILVVCEEWNMTAALLADYWQVLRSTAEPEERRHMPARSPGLRGFQSLDFAGRQFGMFCLLIAQRMSNRVFNGNTDRRENYQIRLMARYSAQTFRMLIPEIKPIRKPKVLGRWLVWAGDEITFVQGLLISDEEAREFAQEGAPCPLTPFSVNARVNDAIEGEEEPVATVLPDDDIDLSLEATGHSQASWSGETAVPRTAGHNQAVPPSLRPLADLADGLEHLGITKNVLRHAARGDEKGDPDFPKVRGGTQFSGYLYDAREVNQWARNKRAAEAARKGKKNG